MVRDTAVTGEAFFGIGLSLDAGASLQAADLSIEGSVGAGLMARRSTVVLADSTIGSTSASDVPGLGIFLLNSSLGASNLGLVDNAGPGAYLHGPESSAEIDGLVAHDNEFAGLVVQTGAALVLRSGVISDTAPSGVGGGGGVGLLTNGASVDLDVEGVSFSGHRGPGLYLTEPGAFRVVDCSFSDSGTAWADQPGGVLAARGDRPVAGAGRDRAVVGPAPSGQPLPRELYHISRLREDGHAQWDIRDTAHNMLQLAKQQAPLTFMLACGKDKFEEVREEVYKD
ncbi:MAG: FAD-dependent thymidylate synthase [Candidatus Brocadiales bacterium]|nr:FAD-dependent thymidylate synthase [Candidatus Brocadiales bacterium]